MREGMRVALHDHPSDENIQRQLAIMQRKWFNLICQEGRLWKEVKRREER